MVDFIMPETGLVILPALILGIIIGIIEIIFVHTDEPGSWFRHAMHAFPFAIIFVFVNMNVEWIVTLFNINLPFNIIFIYLIVGIIAFIKIQTAAAIAGRTGERIWHTLIIALLVVASPYIWQFIGPFVSQYLPFQ